MNLSAHFFKIRHDVADALKQGKPVVALESTIIAHGMPYPQNLETALEVEKVIHNQGVVPATIAVLDGCIKVGLETQEMDTLAKARNVAKVSRRDLPYVMAKKMQGATTVAATMKVAQLAGIRVFVTGGIGGVHRGAETNFDISADLQELAHNNTVVVCAGAKSILDIPLTLEYLETYQVPVIGFNTTSFPAFFARSSPFQLTMHSSSLDEIASMIHLSSQLRIPSGTVVANPIPQEHAIDPKFIDSVIEAALQEAQHRGITGKEVTPFLLAEITRRSEGRSLTANIQLVLNNALVGALLARSLAFKSQD